MCTYNFTHDSNARNSKKLIRLRQKLGAEGYGIYFMLLERLREEEGYMSDCDYDMLSYDLHVSPDKIRQVVEDFGLFAKTDEGNRFYSAGFDERMSETDTENRTMEGEKTRRARKAASARWNRNPEQNACNAESDAQDAVHNTQNIMHNAKDAMHNASIKNALQASCAGFCGQDRPNGDVILAKPDETEKEKKESLEKRSKRDNQRNKKENFFSSSSVPSAEEKSEEEKQQQDFLISSDFFFRNWRDIAQEKKRFISFNSLGGRDFRHMTDGEVEAALTFWKRDKKTKPRVDEDFLALWKQLLDKATASGAGPDLRRDFIDERITFFARDGTLHLICPDSVKEHIERNLDNYSALLKRFMATKNTGSLIYHPELLEQNTTNKH